MTYRTRKIIKGFSLIEIAIVLIIMAVSTSTMFLFLANSANEAKKQDNQTRIEYLNKAITDFYIKTGYIPCPAPRTTAVATAGFGVSSTCSAGAVTGITDTGSGVNTIRYGMIPVRTMGLQDTDAFDAYGNRFTYAIIRDFGINAATYNSAVSATTSFSINHLVISGPTLTNMNVMTSPNSVAYVVISHGPNSNGATAYNGISQTCTAGLPDTYNCDFSDNVFVSSANIPGNFDDTIIWKTKQQLKYDKVSLLNNIQIGGQTYGKYALFTDTVGSGAANYGTGGASTAYYQRNLNTIVSNDLSSAYLSGNSIILGPGTYLIRSYAAACGVDRNLLEVYSATSNSVLISGLAGYADSTTTPTDCRNAYLVGVVILTQTETIYLRHYVQTANTVDGFGRSINTGYNQNYANLEIWEM